MPYMGSPIRPHEELAAGMVDGGMCESCNAKAFETCDQCYKETCEECVVMCAGCSVVMGCESCVSKAAGHKNINYNWYCEECADNYEPPDGPGWEGGFAWNH